MTLEELGYSSRLNESRKELGLDSFGIGRIISEHRERYVVINESGEYEAEIIGNLRYAAESRSDFPAVGDWVAISEYDDLKVLIHAVLPRNNCIERGAVGKSGEKQIIAANLDYAFIVQSVDRDYNLNRIERYLTICTSSGITPVIVLSKIDLVSEQQLDKLIDSISTRIRNIQVIKISNLTHAGVGELLKFIEQGKTYCLLGSSGVGKSTLINSLSGNAIMDTGTISASTNKGRHVTTHRELIVLENGGMIIDNPGMREVGIADAADGLEDTFNAINDLTAHCKFKDCTHVHESGCAVVGAVEEGTIDRAAYLNYLKLQKELAHFESTAAEKRKKDKDFGKMIKNFKKGR